MDKPREKQITVRGVPKEVAERLKKLSAARNESLNATMLRILDEAVGIDARRRRLARYATWTQEDLRSFEETLRAQRVVDPELWR